MLISAAASHTILFHLVLIHSYWGQSSVLQLEIPSWLMPFSTGLFPASPLRSSEQPLMQHIKHSPMLPRLPGFSLQLSRRWHCYLFWFWSGIVTSSTTSSMHHSSMCIIDTLGSIPMREPVFWRSVHNARQVCKGSIPSRWCIVASKDVWCAYNLLEFWKNTIILKYTYNVLKGHFWKSTILLEFACNLLKEHF